MMTILFDPKPLADKSSAAKAQSRL